jgi:hypothetical protein
MSGDAGTLHGIVLESRFVTVAAELGELQPLNNNDDARYAAIVRPHGLDLTAMQLDEADAAVRRRLDEARWYAESDSRWPWPDDWRGTWDDASPDLLRLDLPALATTVADLQAFVRDGWLMMNDDRPDPDQLSRLDALVDDLVATFRDWVTSPILAYSTGLPLQDCTDGEELYGYLVLAGPQRVGILLADYSV